jgi:methanogenic corrinoid protein MtbC1
MMSGEPIGWIREEKTDVVCISAVAPTKIIHARHLCAKLRKNFPDLKIIVGLWGNPEKAKKALAILRDCGANDVVTTVTEAVECTAKYLPIRFLPDILESTGPANTTVTHCTENRCLS